MNINNNTPVDIDRFIMSSARKRVKVDNSSKMESGSGSNATGSRLTIPKMDVHIPAAKKKEKNMPVIGGLAVDKHPESPKKNDSPILDNEKKKESSPVVDALPETSKEVGDPPAKKPEMPPKRPTIPKGKGKMKLASSGPGKEDKMTVGLPPGKWKLNCIGIDADTDSDSVVNERKKEEEKRHRGRKQQDFHIPENMAMQFFPKFNNADKTDLPGIFGQPTFEPRLDMDVMSLYTKPYMKKSAVAQALFDRDCERFPRLPEDESVPYINPAEAFPTIQKMLEMHPSHKVTPKEIPDSVSVRSIPVVTRKFEESQLRNPRGQELACVNEGECVAKKMFGREMVGFYTPQEMEEMQKNGRRDPTRHPCLLCEREMCAYIAVHAAVSNYNPPAEFVAQRHRVIQGPGEYDPRNCIVKGPGILYPMVQNQMNAYELIPESDGYRLLQTGYPIPKNF